MLLYATVFVLLGSFAGSAVSFFRAPAQAWTRKAVVPRRVSREGPDDAATHLRPGVLARKSLDREERGREEQGSELIEPCVEPIHSEGCVPKDSSDADPHTVKWGVHPSDRKETEQDLMERVVKSCSAEGDGSYASRNTEPLTIIWDTDIGCDQLPASFQQGNELPPAPEFFHRRWRSEDTRPSGPACHRSTTRKSDELRGFQSQDQGKCSQKNEWDRLEPGRDDNCDIASKASSAHFAGFATRRSAGATKDEVCASRPTKNPKKKVNVFKYRAERRLCDREISLRTDSGVDRVTLRDISISGLKIKGSKNTLLPGSKVSLDLLGQDRRATVIWSRGGQNGLKFLEPLTSVELAEIHRPGHRTRFQNGRSQTGRGFQKFSELGVSNISTFGPG